MDGSLFAFAAESLGAIRARYDPGCPQAIWLSGHEKNADIPPRGGGGNAPSRWRGAERGRVSTDDVAHRQDHCSAWQFLVYRVERLRCAIACGNGVLHSCTAEWARRSRDVLLAVRVRKVRAPEGGMPANGRAE